MPDTRCRICRHPNRLAIDRALATTQSLRSIAAAHSLPQTTLRLHRAHVAQLLLDAAGARDAQVGGTLVGEMREVQKRAWDLLATMTGEGDHRGAVLAVRECREVLESIDGMLTRAAEALNAGGLTIHVVDAGADGYCAQCPHCQRANPSPRTYETTPTAPFPPPGSGKLLPPPPHA